jgi:hypothetical protein
MLNRTYLAVFAGVFALEVAIALWLRDPWIRPYGGDALVVVLIYACVRAGVVVPPSRLVPAVFAFCCAVEFAQHFQLVARLGLAQSALARTVIGTSFDAGDIVAYALGSIAVLAFERARWRRSVDPLR